MPDFERRNLDRDEFMEYLARSQPRPLVYLGNPPRGDDGGVEADGWVTYCYAASTLAGLWHEAEYGLFAKLSHGTAWAPPDEDHPEYGHYIVPMERKVMAILDDRTEVARNLWASFCRRRHKAGRPDQTVTEALEDEDVPIDRRFTFPEDPDHPLRAAARAVWASTRKDVAKREIMVQRIKEVAGNEPATAVLMDAEVHRGRTRNYLDPEQEDEMFGPIEEDAGVE